MSLLPSKNARTTVAVIPNAQDYYAPKARQIKIQEVMTYIENLGFDPSVVDLREYDKADGLISKLLQFNIVWVMGGNTFCLSYEIQRSGFDKAIRKVLDEGVVYGGESAGALIAGNSLKGVEFADEPEFAEAIVWDTLNLTPNFILPHADNQAFAGVIQKTRDLHKDDTTMVELADDQALVVNGSKRYVSTAKP